MCIIDDTGSVATLNLPASAQHAFKIEGALIPSIQEASALLTWTALNVLLSERVNACALGNIRKFLGEWCPGGNWVGSCYYQGAIQVRVNLTDPIGPVNWYDVNRTVEGDDLISLYGHLKGLPYEVACERLAKDLKLSMQSPKQCTQKPGWREVVVCSYPPLGFPSHPITKLGYWPAEWYYYHNLDSSVRGMLYIFRSATGDPIRLTLSYGECVDPSLYGIRGWIWLGWEDAPIWYDQHQLWNHRHRAVAIFPDEAWVKNVKEWSSNTGDTPSYVPTACSGGFTALPRADWSFLQGRTIIFFVAEGLGACFETALEAAEMAKRSGVGDVYAAALANDALGKIFSSCGNAHRTQYAGAEIIVISLKDFASIARERYGIGPQVLEVPPSAQTLKVSTASEIARAEYYKEREYILEPIMPVKGLIMVYAPRGLGKSWVALTMAYAIATGRAAFDRWTAPRARIVLYLDGEMPMGTIQERLNDLAAGFGDQEPSSNLKFCCADAQDAPIPSIATPEGQEAITALLDGVEVLIVDNLATLATGASENSTEGWTSLQAFFLGLRRKGHSVLMIHHSGKNGDQRGSSAREDILDTSITLMQPKGYQAKEGARVEVHLTKARRLAGQEAEPFEIQLRNEDGVARWECRQDEDERIKVIRPLLEQGLPIRDIAEHTGIPKTTVGRLAKRIRSNS